MSVIGASWARHRTVFDCFNPNFPPIAVLIAMPLIMALFSREWLYTPIGYLDPWYNVGFFLYYHDPTFLADHYKLQRLSWILPGWILYHALGPLIANFALHVGALVVSTIFVYLTLVHLVARQSAFLVAAFLTVYIPFHGSGGWDYQTAGSAAYYAITLYAVTRAAQAEDPRNGLIAAGAAYAAALFATVHLINFLPVLAALYFVVGERHRTRAGVRTALSYGLIGFGGLTLALCMINLAVGRGLFFFWPLLKIVLERVADPAGQKPWLMPWEKFFVPPTEYIYLIFPVVVLAVSTLRLASASIGVGRLRAVRAWMLGQYVFLGLLWMLWQQLGHVALWPDYFAHVLVIPAFLALGGLLGGRSIAEERLQVVLLASGTLLALVPALQGAVGPEIAHSTRTVMTEGTAVIMVAVSAVAIITVALFLRELVAAPLLLSVATFTFSYLQTEFDWRIKPATGALSERYWARAGCVSPERTYSGIVHLFEFFRSENPILWQTWLWRGPRGEHVFDSGCRFDLNYLRGSVHSTGISNLGLPADTNPRQISDEYLNYVVNDGLIVVMVKEEKDAEGLVERFSDGGKKLTLVDRRMLNLGKVPVVVLTYRSNKAN